MPERTATNKHQHQDRWSKNDVAPCASLYPCGVFVCRNRESHGTVRARFVFCCCHACCQSGGTSSSSSSWGVRTVAEIIRAARRNILVMYINHQSAFSTIRVTVHVPLKESPKNSRVRQAAVAGAVDNGKTRRRRVGTAYQLFRSDGRSSNAGVASARALGKRVSKEKETDGGAQPSHCI